MIQESYENHTWKMKIIHGKKLINGLEASKNKKV